MTRMPSLAKSPIAPVLGQRVPIRGPARLLNNSYARSSCNLGDSTRRVTSKFGDEFDVDLSSFLEWQIWAFGSFEEHFARLFQYLVRPGDLCIDIGANVGVHTVRLAKLVGPLGKVIAIEADQALARRAGDNILINHISNARVINAAASDRTGDTVALYRPSPHDANRARASMLPHSYLTGTVAEVSTTTVDQTTSDPVALIKIDVEGCESAVVAGARRTIDTYSPSVIFEYEPKILRSRSDSPFLALRDKGYGLYEIHGNRHVVTGRTRLELTPLPTLPDKGGNILAASAEVRPRLTSLIR